MSFPTTTGIARLTSLQDGDLGTAKFLDCVLSAHPAYDKKYDDTQVLDTICLPEIGASVACADTAGPRPFGMTSDHDFEAQSVSSAIATVADVDESPIVVAIGGRKPGPCTLCDELRSDRLHANWDKFCETIKKQAMAPPAATTNGTAMLMPDAVGNSTMAEATATGGNHDKDLAVMPSDKNTAQTILLAEGHFAGKTMYELTTTLQSISIFKVYSVPASTSTLSIVLLLSLLQRGH